MIRWLTWARKRNGDDGRRSSGVGWTRTSVIHAVDTAAEVTTDEPARTLCGLLTGMFPRFMDETRPKCRRCVAFINRPPAEQSR